jgi:hypothetical protein
MAHTRTKHNRTLMPIFVDITGEQNALEQLHVPSSQPEEAEEEEADEYVEYKSSVGRPPKV